MSLILEALKKSEAQRRLGEMPNLGTPIASTRRRRDPAPWLAFGAVALLVAAGGWYFLRSHPQPAAPGAPAPIKAVTKSESAAPVTTTPVRAVPKPDTPVSAPAAPKKETAESRTAPPPLLPTAAAAPPPSIPPHASATAAVPVAPPVSAPAAAAPVAPPPAPAPPANDVPTIDELPPDLRRAVPDLPITMQVYSPDPKRRFVIIDGARVVEGDSVKGVILLEIRPTGIVLESQGHRVLIPRPGT